MVKGGLALRFEFVIHSVDFWLLWGCGIVGRRRTFRAEFQRVPGLKILEGWVLRGTFEVLRRLGFVVSGAVRVRFVVL